MNPVYIPNRILDNEITCDEITYVILRVKDGKAPGNDNIYNEMLKNSETIKVLHELFQLCFKTENVPQLRRKALIHTFPTGTNLDPKLVSAVSKSHSSF